MGYTLLIKAQCGFFYLAPASPVLLVVIVQLVLHQRDVKLLVFS